MNIDRRTPKIQPLHRLPTRVRRQGCQTVLDSKICTYFEKKGILEKSCAYF